MKNGRVSRPTGPTPALQPTRLFYRIGEVSRQTAVPSYVLRYWETEFSTLRPRKGQGRQRLYTPADIETIRRIKQMLYEDGLKIRAARRHLNRPAGLPHHLTAGADVKKLLEKVKAELRAVLEVVSRTNGTT